MRKTLLLSLLTLLSAATATAHEFTSGSLTYTVINETDKTCMTKAGEYTYAGQYHPGHNISGKLVIPEKVSDGSDEYVVTTIGDYSFCDEGAFSDEISPTGLVLPNSIIKIGTMAFKDCKKMKGALIIPESTQTIERAAFSGCNSLTSLEIGSSIVSIEAYAFNGCTSLKKVTSLMLEPCAGNENLFSAETYANATLIVPAGTLETYMETVPWKNFLKIIESAPEDPELGAIEDVTSDATYAIDYSEPYEVYTLQGTMMGRSIEDLAPGLYIVRQGTRIAKTVIR